MRPKVFDFTLANAETTTIYWPVDTHVAVAEFAVQFTQVRGTGSIATMSAAETQWPVLARGVTSASFVQLTAAAALGFTLLSENPASCFRYSFGPASGSVGINIVGLQYGPEPGH